jgi:hypothetical protein
MCACKRVARSCDFQALSFDVVGSTQDVVLPSNETEVEYRFGMEVQTGAGKVNSLRIIQSSATISELFLFSAH